MVRAFGDLSENLVDIKTYQTRHVAQLVLNANSNTDWLCIFGQVIYLIQLSVFSSLNGFFTHLPQRVISRIKWEKYMLCPWHSTWLSRYPKTLIHLHGKSGQATWVKPSLYSTSLCLSLGVLHFFFGCVPIKLYLQK